MLHAGAEADRLPQPEVIDVGVEVGRDLRVVGVVGEGGRHREVREGHPLARRVDVQLAVRRRHAVRVAEDPVAAHAVGGLEGRDVEAALAQCLERGDAGGARADDGRGGQLGHAANVEQGDAGVNFGGVG
jgi:hypothetical protein